MRAQLLLQASPFAAGGPAGRLSTQAHADTVVKIGLELLVQNPTWILKLFLCFTALPWS